MSEIDYLASHLFHRFLGRNPSDQEHADMVQYGLDNGGIDGYFWPDEKLRSQPANVPILLLYSSCHCEQILCYLKAYRPDVLEACSVNILFTHRLLLRRGFFSLEWVQALFGHADKLLCNLMSPKFQELSTVNLLPSCKVACKVVSFVPPSFAALWPVVRHFGEEPVAKGLLAGKSAADMIAEFHVGTLDCMFGDRYEQQMARLRKKEETCDVRITDFMERHLKTTKLYFCSNHPSYNLIAHITNKSLGWLGFSMKEDAHALAVPTNGANFHNHWPESNLEWEHYGFEYPQRYTADWGGASKFYPAVIEESVMTMRDPKAVLANPITPVELE